MATRTMRPPYDLRTIADRAGTGDDAPIPQDPPRCAWCDGPLPETGRSYCGRPRCLARRATTDKRAERRGEELPSIARYSW